MQNIPTYQLDLFDYFANSEIIRPTHRRSKVSIEERNRDSDGRYVRYESPTTENETEKLKRELETERRRNKAVASMLRNYEEKVIKLTDKLKENGIAI